MRKKVSISLLIMIAISLLGLYICSITMLIGVMVILGAIVSEFMYLAMLIEPNELDKYLSEMDRQLDEEDRLEKENVRNL